MTSFTTSFTIGSAVSATGSAFSDAFESYRRAQYLVAESAVASVSDASDFEEEDEETGFRREPIPESEGEYEDDDPVSLRGARDGDFFQFDWDDDLDSLHRRPAFRSEESSHHLRRFDSTNFQRPPRLTVPRLEELRSQESTPLLQRKPSSIQDQLSIHESVVKDYGIGHTPQDVSHLAPPPPLRRRSSANSQTTTRSVRYSFGGRSTYGQTLFNSIAILLGIGMLSEPLAFAYSGWIGGTLLIITYAYISCYTAKILAKIILTDPRLRSYSDIGRKAFGPRATIFISIMFCLELFAVTVILVTLYADSLHTIIPRYSSDTYKLWGLVLLIPTVFLPLSLLSYTSIFGIASTIILVVVIFIDGLSKKEAPGSFWAPAPTEVGVKDLNKLGLAFGLFMAGFSGHPVIPSLARDMADPSQFDTMINWAFGIATFIYIAIGSAGYIMFGNKVHDEISIDLLQTPGYDALLNQICLWLLVISPLSKFALNTQPLNTTIEILLGIDTPASLSAEALATKPDGLSISPRVSQVTIKKTLAVFQRIFMTLLSVLVSMMIPEFSSMMAFLGAFSAFILGIVGPVLAKVTIAGHCGLFDGTVIVVGTLMGVWGTLAAFWSA